MIILIMLALNFIIGKVIIAYKNYRQMENYKMKNYWNFTQKKKYKMTMLILLLICISLFIYMCIMYVIPLKEIYEWETYKSLIMWQIGTWDDWRAWHHNSKK